MPGEALLIGIATVAVAVAGFTAITSTLAPPGRGWSGGMRIRQRAIVSTSFNVVFEALAPSIVYAGTGDPRASVALASGGVALYATGIIVWRGRQFVRAGGARNPATLVLFALGPIATALFWANALALGSLAIYALALCIQLSVAVMSFYTLVSAAQA
jgi:hypothetical protein